MEIALVKNKGICLVDNDSFDLLKGKNWCLSSRGYAQCSENGKTIFMHRLILNPDGKLHVDHINGNKLDNRKINLRICSHAENIRNRGKHKKKSSKFKGVWFFVRAKKWKASIYFNSKNIYLGTFLNEVDAALTYNEAAIKYHGKFARLNEVKNEPR